MSQETETADVKNTVTIEDMGPCKKKVVIEIPEKSIQDALDEQYNELRKDAIVPGFRKGRVPRRLLEKRFGKETCEQVKLKLLAEASEAAIKDNDLDTLGELNIEHKDIKLPENGPLKFDFEVEVRPEFELPVLEGIPVEKPKMEVTDERIEQETEALQRRMGLWVPQEDGTVEAEDQVIADVLLKIEDVEEKEKLDNTTIFVRENGFVGKIPVEKLDAALAGAKQGDVKTTSVDVPKTFFDEKYRGKKVEVEISVKDIKRLIPAELNEEFFNKIGVSDETELREQIREMLQRNLEGQVRTSMTEQIYKYLTDSVSFDLPLDVVADQSAKIFQRQYASLAMSGLERQKIEERMEQIRASSEEQAREQLKLFFIMEKVAEKLEIEVDEEEINGRIAQVAMQQGQRPEKMREQMERDGSLAQFSLQVREQKCIEKLLESAKITEVKTKSKKKAAKKAAAGKAAAKTNKPASKEKDKTSTRGI